MRTRLQPLLLLALTLLLTAGCTTATHPADAALAARRAYRQQLAKPSTRPAALQAGLHHADPLIRQNALYETIREHGQKSIASIEHLTRDPDPRVQKLLLDYVKTIADDDLRLRLARDIRAHASAPSVLKEANTLFGTFNFQRHNLRLKNNPTWDHEIETLQTITLADDNWKIAADPAEIGHEKKYYAVDFDDTSWKPVRVGGWEHQGLGAYDGIAWYRIRFKAPAKDKANAAELHFGAVDEVAWVWLNGTYVSQHDLGADGWDTPFALDITPEIKWGEENLLVVRVLDSAQQGGIWKPVSLHILK